MQMIRQTWGYKSFGALLTADIFVRPEVEIV